MRHLSELFDSRLVLRFAQSDLERPLQDEGSVRSRGSIAATVDNVQRVRDVLASLLRTDPPLPHHRLPIPFRIIR